MNSLCISGCGGVPVTTPPDNYYACANVYRTCGIKNFLLAKCDLEFTDLKDFAVAGEWDTAIQNGDIIITPPGIMTVNDPTFDTFDIDCDQVGRSELTWTADFITYQTADDLSDQDYWCFWEANAPAWRLFYLDCNDMFRFPDPVITLLKGIDPAPPLSGESLGWNFSFAAPPREIPGEGNRCQWTMQVQWDTDTCIRGVYLPEVLGFLKDSFTP